jgi:hypothetical protein
MLCFFVNYNINVNVYAQNAIPNIIISSLFLEQITTVYCHEVIVFESETYYLKAKHVKIVMIMYIRTYALINGDTCTNCK